MITKTGKKVMDKMLNTHPVPVVALTIVNSKNNQIRETTRDSELLVVVRDVTTNLTHPNVISVPTQRIPVSLFSDIIGSGKLAIKTQSTTYFTGEWIANNRQNGHNPIIYAIEALLARKLGAANALETRTLAFESQLKAMMVGQSYHPQLPIERRYENISMLNIKVFIDRYNHEFPSQTASYSHILWTSVETFIETVQKKQPEILEPNLDPLEYCIHGLCIWSTYNILGHELGLKPIDPFQE
jgi:hypothetical protein